jgi:cytochrome c551
MKRLKLLIPFFIAIVMLTACGQAKQNSNVVTLQQAPNDVASLYKSNCMGCHAVDLSGKMGESTNLQQVHTRLNQEEIATKISVGGETMPAFEEQLTSEEINGLAAWLAKQ